MIRARYRGAGAWLALFVIAEAGGPLFAQTPGTPPPTTEAVTQAAATITAADLSEDLAVLAADSMRGPTPSAALERKARYLARKFEALGLSLPSKAGAPPRRPGTPFPPPQLFQWNGDTNGVQRYPVPGQFQADYANSDVTFSMPRRWGNRPVIAEEGREIRAYHAVVKFTTAARLLGSTMPAMDHLFGWSDSRPSVLVAGPQTPASLRDLDARGKTVLYVPSSDTAGRPAIIRELAARSAGIVVVSSADSIQFSAQVQGEILQARGFGGGFMPKKAEPWVVEVWPGAMAQVLELNDVNVEELRRSSVAVTRDLPALEIGVGAWKGAAKDTVTGPNVVAILPGTDRERQKEFLAIVVPLDRRGPNAPDESTGLAALLALAKALSQPGARPPSSVVFVATSGGADRWGSYYLMSQGPHPRIALTLEFADRSTADSVAVKGLRDVEVAPSPAWTAALHPELGVTVVDSGSVLTPGSEAAVFVSQWVPTLAFQGGKPTIKAGVRPAAADVPEVRTLRLMFYVIHGLAGEPQPPRWNAAARQRLAATSEP